MSNNQPIRVEYLCNEPFWKFTTSEKTSHCKVCKHTLKDYTEMAEPEIRALLDQNNGNLCGIFFKDQFAIDENTKHGKTFKQLLLAGSLTTFFSLSAASQNTVNNSVKTEQYINYEAADYGLVKDSIQVKEDVRPNEPQCRKQEPARKKRRYFRIGRNRYYVNSSVPFIHKKATRVGKFF